MTTPQRVGARRAKGLVLRMTAVPCLSAAWPVHVDHAFGTPANEQVGRLTRWQRPLRDARRISLSRLICSIRDSYLQDRDMYLEVADQNPSFVGFK